MRISFNMANMASEVGFARMAPQDGRSQSDLSSVRAVNPPDEPNGNSWAEFDVDLAPASFQDEPTAAPTPPAVSMLTAEQTSYLRYQAMAIGLNRLMGAAGIDALMLAERRERITAASQ
jgi:hypothetical protein